MILHFQKKMAILIVSLTMFIELLDGTALNTSLPQIAKDFSLDPTDLSLAITTYLFAFGVCIPLSAFLVDRFGIKNILLLAFFTFFLGSIGCGYSASVEQLVFFRFVQGVGGALMLPAGRLAIARIFGKELISAMAIVTTVSLTGPMIGPVLGGYLTTVWGWQWIFFINLPFFIFAFLITLKYFPNIPVLVEPSQFDFIGFIILFSGFGLLIFSSEISVDFYPIMFKLFAIICGLGIILLYIIHARRMAHPLVNIQVFQNHLYKNIALGNFIIRFSMGAYPFLIPMLLFQKYEFSAFQVGLLMLSFVLGTWIIKPFITKLLARYDTKSLLLANSVLLALAQFGLIFFVFSFNFIAFFIYGIVMGGLNSIQFSSMNSSMFLSLHDKDKAHGNAIYLSLSQLGGCIGITLTSFVCVLFEQLSMSVIISYQFSIVLMVILTLSSSIFFKKIHWSARDNLFIQKKIDAKNK